MSNTNDDNADRRLADMPSAAFSALAKGDKWINASPYHTREYIPKKHGKDAILCLVLHEALGQDIGPCGCIATPSGLQEYKTFVEAKAEFEMQNDQAQTP